MTTMHDSSGERPAHRAEGLLRDCGSVIAALFLACAVILPLLEPTGEEAAAEGGSGAALASSLFWGAVIALLGWRRPQSLSLAGTTLIGLSVTAVLAMEGVVRFLSVEHVLYNAKAEEPTLKFSEESATVLVQAAIIGALLLGGALATALREIEESKGGSGLSLKRIVLGLLAGAAAAWLLTTILYGSSTLLREGSFIFSATVLLVVCILCMGTAAISPVALGPLLVGMLLLDPFANADALGPLELAEQDFGRYRLQLMAVILAAGASMIPLGRTRTDRADDLE